MTVTLVALIYALVSAGIGWAFLLVAGQDILRPDERVRYIVLWVVLALCLFLAPSGTFFLLAAFAFLIILRFTAADPIVLAMFLIAAVPPAGVVVTNLPGGINYLLKFTFALMLSMVLLAPAAMTSLGKRRPGGLSVDLFAAAFFFLVILLGFRQTTFTNGLRLATELFFVSIVPYLALSRAVRDAAHLERIVVAFVSCLVVAATIGFVGAVIGWQVYDAPVIKLFDAGVTAPMWRLGLMRTGGTLGGAPISFGTMMVIGAGLIAGLTPLFTRKWQPYVLIGLCLVGLLASVSRGPLLGAVAAVFAFQLVRPHPMRSTFKVTALGVLAFIPLALGPARGLLDILPFIGTEAGNTVSYRQDLFAGGLAVVKRHPLFGSPNFLDEPEMQALIQGQGIIDLVNTYLTVALQHGLVGLALFVGSIIATLIAVLRTARRLDPNADLALRMMGGGLFTGLFAYAFIIATTSLTGVLDFLGWMLVGLNVTYVRVAKAHLAASANAALATADPSTAEEAEPAADVPVPASVAAEAPVPVVAPSSFGLQTPIDLDFAAIIDPKSRGR